MAVDLIPAGTQIPYAGRIFDEWQLKALKKKFGVEPSREYAKKGPKAKGVDYLIFGNMVSRKKNPYGCAGKVNARNPDNKSQKNIKDNATWSEVLVTPEIKARFPESGDHMVVGEEFPSILIQKDVHPGEEIILKTYGKGFWARQRNERANKGDINWATTMDKKAKLKKIQKENSNYYAVLALLKKQHLTFLDSLEIKNITRDKRGVKRARAEAESEKEESPKPKKRRIEKRTIPK